MKVGVVADDLTGANATGVRLSNQGFHAATIIYNHIIPNIHPLDAVCVNTDSRYAPDDVVKERIKQTMQSLREWETDIICKRIDSTIRGNMGLEIDSVLNELDEKSVAIVVASFPDSDRISLGGYLLVNQVPVQNTDVAKDPVMPITQSYIPSIIQAQSENSVSHIGLDDVLQGNKVLEQSLGKEIEKGNRIIVVDAVSDEDIDVIAEAMVAIQMAYTIPLVPVDPGPLTAAFSHAMSHHLTETKKVIVTVGSVTSISEMQLGYLIEKTNSSPVYVSAENLASFGPSWEEEVERAAASALKRIDEDDVLIVTTHVEGAYLVNLKGKALEEETTQDALAKRIADGLATITRLVMEETSYSIQGCFTSGGDVTASLVSVTHASGIGLEDEVLPLAAYGTLIGGLFPGLPIMTKGGMIGDKKAIYTSVKYLRTKRSGII